MLQDREKRVPAIGTQHFFLLLLLVLSLLLARHGVSRCGLQAISNEALHDCCPEGNRNRFRNRRKREEQENVRFLPVTELLGKRCLSKIFKI